LSKTGKRQGLTHHVGVRRDDDRSSLDGNLAETSRDNEELPRSVQTPAFPLRLLRSLYLSTGGLQRSTSTRHPTEHELGHIELHLGADQSSFPDPQSYSFWHGQPSMPFPRILPLSLLARSIFLGVVRSRRRGPSVVKLSAAGILGLFSESPKDVPALLSWSCIIAVLTSVRCAPDLTRTLPSVGGGAPICTAFHDD